jgi:hypothetical protein
MKNQDYILLIMNCNKNRYKAEYQKKTWLLSIPKNIIYFHVIGDELLEKEYLFDDMNQILYVKTKDDYNSLPHKVIQSFFAINNEYIFKYVFKTDDDQLLTDVHFFDNLILSVENERPNYGGYLIEVLVEYISEYYYYHPELPKDILVKCTKYCNGRFYILSNCAVINLLVKKEEIKQEYLEDYSIGFYMDDSIKQQFLPIDNSVFIDVCN